MQVIFHPIALIRCLRRSFFYDVAHLLLEKTDVVIHEELTITNMVRRPKKKEDEQGRPLQNRASRTKGLRRSIYDAGWGVFLGVLRNSAQKLGKKVIGVNPRYTTQECSQCGHLVQKSLSTRTHSCSECGYTANRDYNAAINILRLGLESLA